MPTFPLVDAFAKKWWVLLLRGVLAILFGIIAFAMPGLTLITMALAFGAYALIDGLSSIWVGVGTKAWGMLLFGLIGAIVGIYAIFSPAAAALTIVFVIGFWAIARGIAEIVTAISLRKEITDEWFLILSGILSIVFGLVLFARPGAGALALIWVIGAYALLIGLLLIILAFKVKGLPERVAKLAGAA